MTFIAVRCPHCQSEQIVKRVVFQICTFTGMYAMLSRSLERGTLWYSFLYDVPIVRAIT